MASTSVAKQSSATKKFPNWLEMPDELMANILQRLRTAEKLKSARKVCTTWRRICKDPAMWKIIDLYKFLDDRKAKDSGMETLTKQAVHLSCGELIDISISGFGNDDLLDYISLRSSKLKRLCLVDCNKITGSGLVGQSKGFHSSRNFTLLTSYSVQKTLKSLDEIALNSSALRCAKTPRDPSIVTIMPLRSRKTCLSYAIWM